MPKNDRPDVKALLSKFTLTKRGRTRAITYKKPRDRLIDSLGKQIEMVHLLQEKRDPKVEGYKERKMFFFDRGYYIVQIKYNSQPLDLTPEADTFQVDTLEQVEEVLNTAITLANAGHFDEQLDRLATEWASTRKGPRGPRKRAQASAEEAA